AYSFDNFGKEPAVALGEIVAILSTSIAISGPTLPLFQQQAANKKTRLRQAGLSRTRSRLFGLWCLFVFCRGFFFDAGCRSNDRCDGKVAIGDDGLYTLWQGNVRNMKAVTDLVAREVHGNIVGDGVGRAEEFYRVTNNVENAANLDAGLFFVDEADRNINADFRVLRNAEEIDVKREVTNRIAL